MIVGYLLVGVLVGLIAPTAAVLAGAPLWALLLVYPVATAAGTLVPMLLAARRPPAGRTAPTA